MGVEVITGNPVSCLFDLKTDPSEENDLSSSQDLEYQELKDRIYSFVLEMRPSVWRFPDSEGAWTVWEEDSNGVTFPLDPWIDNYVSESLLTSETLSQVPDRWEFERKLVSSRNQIGVSESNIPIESSSKSVSLKDYVD